MSPKNTKLKKNKKNFYVGSDTILEQAKYVDKGNEYVTDLDTAISKAVEKARKTNRPQIVVQIVRKIEVLPPPVRIKVV